MPTAKRRDHATGAIPDASGFGGWTDLIGFPIFWVPSPPPRRSDSVPEKPTMPAASKTRDNGKPKSTDRDRRRAEALRANLRRRKAQSRDRKDSQSPVPPRDDAVD